MPASSASVPTFASFPPLISPSASSSRSGSASPKQKPAQSRRTSSRLSSMSTTSLSSTSSSAPLMRTAPPTTGSTTTTTAPKDYESAFGALQTQYGWAPACPVPAPAPSLRLPSWLSRKAKKTSLAPSAPEREEEKSDARRYEDAFAALSTQYGVGVGAAGLSASATIATPRS